MMQANVLTENIGDQLAALSPAQRKLLQLRLMKKNQGANNSPLIPHDPDRVTAPLSYNQQGLWVLNQLMDGETLYHTPTAARLRGPLDVAALKNALQAIVDRHAALRTVFRIVEGTPQQFVNDFRLDVPVVDLKDISSDVREAEALRLLKTESTKPFDLMNGPLLRAFVVRLNEDDHMMLVTMHHIVTDGWSMGIFNRELAEFYRAYVNGKEPSLPDLSIQYSDYATWQREWLSGIRYTSQLDYWKSQFATPSTALELPTDHPRQSMQELRGVRAAHHKLVLSSELTGALKQLSQTENVTLFMMLIAAFKVLLHRYTNEEDIVVGTPIAGREQPQTEDLIGLFINTLALRTNVSSDLTFAELLARVKQTAIGAYQHSALPFERLVKEVQPNRAAGQNPLFQVMFVLQTESIQPLNLDGLTVEPFRIENPLAKFDLTLDIFERDRQLICQFEANAELFEAATIERMMGHFQVLLEAIVNDPSRRVVDLPILTDAERNQLLVEWNRTEAEYPAMQGIHELFERQAASTPDAVALISGDEELTYCELNQRANRLAHYLRERGVKPDTLVGMHLERTTELIIALMAILKAGGAYVPLDPAYPEGRLELMIRDSGAPLLLTQKSLATKLPSSDAVTICIDELSDELARQSDLNPPSVSNSENVAYVIYTSGSTGKPKGVLVPHRSVVNLLTSVSQTPGMTSRDVVLAITTVSFDIAVSEVILPLTVGAKIVLVPREVAADGAQLLRIIRDRKVTFVDATPATWRLLLAAGWVGTPGLTAICTGEAMPSDLAVSLTERAERVWNGYGPTETTVWSSFYEVPRNSKRVLIGRPIANTALYVLGANLEPVPIGVSGELYIGGDGVTLGYHNRPDLTDERFVADPFRPGARMYKTGDVARFLPDGNLECLGRNDDQVKLRGYRIELGEIETALMDHHAIREAAVIVRNGHEEKHLAAYLVPRNDNLVTSEVREFLRTRLPEYMVPSVFGTLPALPVSPAGKVDRRALASMNGFKRESQKPFIAAADELELRMTKAWQRVLNIGTIGVDENFFELGGHSLLAVQLFAEIEKTFGKNLPLATLFQAPTIRQLARALRDEGWQPAWSSLVTIQSGDAKRAPFFCIHAVGGNVIEYRDLARLLGSDQPVYGLQALGLDGEAQPHTSIKEMATHYLKELRELQPEGPYFIGGRSSGGTVAFEMACQLEAGGEKVEVLALLDTYPAGYFKLLQGASTLRGRAARVAHKYQSHLLNLGKLKSEEKLRYVARKLRYAPAKIKHRIYRRGYKLYKKFGRPLPAILQNIEEINFAAVKDYEPRVYSGDVELFIASDLTSDYDLLDGWRELVRGRIRTHEISGDHLNIIKEPQVGEVAAKLRLMLDEAAACRLTRE